jgi:hypothetical protein
VSFWLFVCRCVHFWSYRRGRAACAALGKYDLSVSVCHDTLSGGRGLTVGLTTDRAPGAAAGRKGSAAAAAGVVEGGGGEGALQRGVYRSQLCNKATGQWFEVQDLSVSETMPQMVALSEASLLVYERQSPLLALTGGRTGHRQPL